MLTWRKRNNLWYWYVNNINSVNDKISNSKEEKTSMAMSIGKLGGGTAESHRETRRQRLHLQHRSGKTHNQTKWNLWEPTSSESHALGSRIAYHHSAPEKNLVRACLAPCCSPTCRAPRAHLLLRHQNPHYNQDNTIHSKNTQCIIKNHSVMKTQQSGGNPRTTTPTPSPSLFVTHLLFLVYTPFVTTQPKTSKDRHISACCRHCRSSQPSADGSWAWMRQQTAEASWRRRWSVTRESLGRLQHR